MNDKKPNLYSIHGPLIDDDPESNANHLGEA